MTFGHLRVSLRKTRGLYLALQLTEVARWQLCYYSTAKILCQQFFCDLDTSIFSQQLFWENMAKCSTVRPNLSLCRASAAEGDQEVDRPGVPVGHGDDFPALLGHLVHQPFGFFCVFRLQDLILFHWYTLLRKLNVLSGWKLYLIILYENFQP